MRKFGKTSVISIYFAEGGEDDDHNEEELNI
jgi:hypothetical protein